MPSKNLLNECRISLLLVECDMKSEQICFRELKRTAYNLEYGCLDLCMCKCSWRNYYVVSRRYDRNGQLPWLGLKPQPCPVVIAASVVCTIFSSFSFTDWPLEDGCNFPLLWTHNLLNSRPHNMYLHGNM